MRPNDRAPNLAIHKPSAAGTAAAPVVLVAPPGSSSQSVVGTSTTVMYKVLSGLLELTDLAVKPEARLLLSCTPTLFLLLVLYLDGRAPTKKIVTPLACGYVAENPVLVQLCIVEVVDNIPLRELPQRLHRIGLEKDVVLGLWDQYTPKIYG